MVIYNTLFRKLYKLLNLGIHSDYIIENPHYIKHLNIHVIGEVTQFSLLTKKIYLLNSTNIISKITNLPEGMIKYTAPPLV